MTDKKLIALFNNAITKAKKEEFSKHLEVLLTSVSEAEASKTLAQIITDRYTRFTSDYLAVFLEIIIKRNPNLASIKNPINDFFVVAVILGSMDLYDCYIEVGIEPYLLSWEPENQKLYYKELAKVAAELNEKIVETYKEKVLGRDYNGKFGIDETNENTVLINSEDYDIMDETLLKYNQIIGRRNILKDLIKRTGMKLMHS